MSENTKLLDIRKFLNRAGSKTTPRQQPILVISNPHSFIVPAYIGSVVNVLLNTIYSGSFKSKPTTDSGLKIVATEPQISKNNRSGKEQ